LGVIERLADFLRTRRPSLVDDQNLYWWLLLRLVCSASQRTRSARQERTWRPTLNREPDEPEPVAVGAQTALRFPRIDVDPGHPLLIRVAGQLTGVLDAIGGGGQSDGDTDALTEVVVISAGSIALDVGTRRIRCAAVELHPAMHPHHPPQRRPSTTNGPLEMPRGPPDHGRPIYEHS
jgi:hypothetical protein